MLPANSRTCTGAQCSTSGLCSPSPRAGLFLQHSAARSRRAGSCQPYSSFRDLSTRLAAADAALGAAGEDPSRGYDAVHATAPAAADRRKLWMAAIKPPMYSVGFIPVLVGAAAAFSECGVLVWGRVAQLVFGAISIIAWLNLSNDAFDAQTGVDKSKPESFVNITGNRAGVMFVAWAAFALGVALLGGAISAANDPRIAARLGAAIACGYVYQGPPFRLSYKGLGEPLCFTAFGPLATSAFYLALLPQPPLAAAAAAAGVAQLPPAVPAGVCALSAAVGVTTAAILFCSHFHQVAGDLAAGKMSPLVRLGTTAACKVLTFAVALPYLIILTAVACSVLPLPLLPATVLSLPIARALVQFANDNHLVPEQVRPLKIIATKWHIAFGLCLVLGLVASGLLPAKSAV